MNTLKCAILGAAWLVIATFGAVHAQEPIPTISVRGHAQITLAADNAVMMTTIEGRAKEAVNAYESVEKQSQEVFAFLKQTGIADEAVRLQPIALSRYVTRQGMSKAQQGFNQKTNQSANSDDQQVEQTAYHASRSLAIAVSDLKKLNTIHLGLIQRGVERLDKVHFKSSKSAEEFAKLRQVAVSDARTKAQAMAAVLGAELKSIRTMEDRSSPAPVGRAGGSSGYGDPFSDSMGGGMGGEMGSMGGGQSPSIIVHEATVDIVFILGKADLK